MSSSEKEQKKIEAGFVVFVIFPGKGAFSRSVLGNFILFHSLLSLGNKLKSTWQ